MTTYRNIEERLCTECREVVAIEFIHMEDGSVFKRCLSKTCGRPQEDNRCFFLSVK